MEVSVVMRKLVIVSGRRCWRSVRQHPFLVGFLCFLFLLYRSFPLLFSLLVSASPILICTAILLGTLLSFGEPRYPEIEKEERVSEEVSHLKTESLGDSTVVVSRDGSVISERFMDDKRDIIERAVERVISANGEARVAGEGDGLLDRTPLIHDHFSVKAQEGSEKLASDNVDKVDGEDEKEEEGEKGRDLDVGEVGVHRYSLIEEAEDDVRVENGELKRDLSDAHAESTVSSKHGVDQEDDKEEEQEEKEKEEEQEEEEEDDDGGSSASDSDRAESSSPDASMADILPMLDELHPLLEREDQQALLSPHESNVASEHSHDSENGNMDSESDSESAEGEDGERENDDEEESPAVGKEDAGKSAITWTEDDQKNLMDLGTSELERNQRLENLIARRRARRFMAEKNLIDFEGSDLPFNVPSIATTRNNPFDGPDDTYSGMGLPPIPGSAPSILLPRRNPFDLPYEPNEEKPDLKEDNLKEFVSPPPAQPPPQNQHRDNFFFRRHESFHVGPSRHDVKWKPYFVPEHLASEGTSFRPFERQSSGMSDSKASSVPDTESVTSTVDNEEKTNESEELLNETEEMSNMDRASLLVEHGSVASDDTDHQEIDDLEGEHRNTHHEEVEIILGDAEADTENQHDIGPSLSEDGIRSSASARSDVNEYEVKKERVEQEGEEEAEEKEQQQEKEGEEEEKKEEAKSSGSGSSSIFSEVDEKIDEVKKDGGASSSQINYPNEELRPQLDDVEFSFVTDHHKEPVYDSSPKYHSFSSGSSDPRTHGESEFEEDMQNVDHGNKNHARDADPTENREDDSRRIGSLESEEEIFVEQNGSSNISEATNEEVANVSVPPSSGVDAIDHDLVNDTHVQHEQDSIEPQPSNMSSVVTELSMDSEDPFPSEQGKSHSMSNERVVDDIIGSNHHGQVQHKENHQAEMDMEVSSNEQTNNPASDNRHILSDLSDESPHEEHPFAPEERSTLLQEISEMGEQHLDSDVLSSSDVIHDISELPDELEKSIEEISAVHEENSEEVLDYGVKDLVVVSTLASQSPTYSSSSNYESPTAGPSSGYQTPGGEEYRVFRRQITEYYDPSLEIFGTLALDEALKQAGHEEIKDIDEGFLMELDAVGDFRIIETGNTSHSPKPIGYDDNSRDAHSESDSQNLSESGHCEPRSVEDITMAFRQLDEGGGVKEHLPSSINGDVKSLEGAELGLPDIEVRSIDGNAKKLPENTDGESLDVEVLLLEGTIGNEPNDSNVSSSKGDSSNLPTLEVRSMEDVKLAFKQLDEGAEIDEVILPSSIKDQQESESSEGTILGLPVVEVRSREDVTMAFKQLDEGAEIDEVILPSSIKDHQELESLDRTSSSLPVRSRDDVTMAFKQLYEGAEIDEVILPSSIKDQQDSQSSEVTSSGLLVVEARSHDDVTMALKQLHEGAGIDEVILPNSIKDLQVSQSEATNSGLPVIEARSRDDVTMTFKQLDEGLEIDEVILPSSIKDQHDLQSLEGSSSGLPVVEARSHEDVTMALKQLHEGSEIDEVILPSSIKYQQESKGSEVTSSGLPVVEVWAHDDVKMAFKQLDEGAEIDEVILPSSIKDQQELKSSEGTSAGLPIVEARSRDVVTMVFKQLQEGAEIDEVILPSSIEDQKISEHSEGKSSGLPVVEARSLGDVTMTFQQLEEGAKFEEIILPSSIKYQKESESSSGTSSGLLVVEARTLDDIHNIAKQVVEENYEVVPGRTIESEDRSVEAEATQETKEVHSEGGTTIEAGISKSSDSSAKKKKSRKSKSGSDSSSGSSSSSSSSDSD